MRRRLFVLPASVVILTLTVVGCASREEADEDVASADELATDDLTICRNGTDLVPHDGPEDAMSPLAVREASYRSAGVLLEFGNVAPKGAPDNLQVNAAEYDFLVDLRPESGQGTLRLDRRYYEACNGTLRILAQAKVDLGAKAAELQNRFCAPSTLAGTQCELKDGVKVTVSARWTGMQFGYVTPWQDNVKLRAAPTTDSAVLEVVAPQTPLALLGERHGAFESVRRGDKKGWVDGDLMAFVGHAVTTDRLKLRTFPTLRSNVYTVLPAGTEIEIWGSAFGQFTLARYQNFYGYVSGRFLKDLRFEYLSPGGD
jgi:hypothetical protein